MPRSTTRPGSPVPTRQTTIDSAAAPVDGSESSSRAPREAARRVVHIAAGLAAAAVAWIASPAQARIILTAAVGVAVAVDLARRRYSGFSRAFDRAVGTMVRPHERRGWVGATLLAVGFALAAWLTPPRTAAVAFLLAGLGDPAASAIGSRFGRLRTPWGKSLAGSIAFTIVGLAVVAALPDVDARAAAPAVLVAALVEAAPLDDNLGVPVVGALLLHALGAVS